MNLPGKQIIIWKASRPPRMPKSFLDAYPGRVTGYVTPETMEEFLLSWDQFSG
jgi:hypothetical protein